MNPRHNVYRYYDIAFDNQLNDSKSFKSLKRMTFHTAND